MTERVISDVMETLGVLELKGISEPNYPHCPFCIPISLDQTHGAFLRMKELRV